MAFRKWIESEEAAKVEAKAKLEADEETSKEDGNVPSAQTLQVPATSP